jgi:galactose oxidase-like protein
MNPKVRTVAISIAPRMAPVLFGATGYVPMALAEPPGTFTPTGNMTTALASHSATLLPNGKVVITRGTYYFAQSSDYTQQLYEPATRTFNVTGGTATANGLATLLGNGKVLITGTTAQLYDPATDTFTPTGGYVGDFYYGTLYYPDTATLLPDGRVLIVGNAAGDGYFEREELYDPITGTFKQTDKVHTFGFGSDIWSGHTATLLQNGKVLLAGGVSEDFGYFSVAELFDPSTDTFTATGNMTVARAGHSATLLPDGTVLIAGGMPFNGTSAEVYNPATGTFCSTGSMTTPRSGHTATLLPDGTVLLAGGQPFDGSTSAEVYNPATGMFSSTGNMTTPRFWQAATLVPDGTVLMTGGEIANGVALASAELYTPLSLVPVPVPVLLSLAGDGKDQGAIQHAGTTRIASAGDPAVPGEYLSMYLNGLADGSVIPPQVVIGGRLAEVTFFGNVPGTPGLNVVNIRMPGGVVPGPAIPVRLTDLGRPSNQVTIGVALDPVLQQAITAMKTAAGTDTLNFWQWAWFWQCLPGVSGTPAGFGVIGSISPDMMEQIITAGGGDPLRKIAAEQWILYFRQVVPQ